MIDLTGFAPRDQKLIKDNEGKSVYELLQLGLSQKAADRLADMNSGESTDNIKEEILAETQKPKQVQPEQSNVVKPSSIKKVESKTQLTAPKEYARQKVTLNSGSVKVHNKRTGKIVTMSANAARRLTKSPNMYTIVN